MRYAVLTSILLFFILAAVAKDGPTVNQTQFPPSYIPSGQEMYKQFCAACHGADAKGDGPCSVKPQDARLGLNNFGQAS
jgi:mono/diheme cytochrome c family protein